MGRRLVALLIDWVLCYLIVSALHHRADRPDAGHWRRSTGVFACGRTSWLFTA